MELFYKGNKISINSTGFGFILVQNEDEKILIQRRTKWQDVVFDDLDAVSVEIKQNIDTKGNPDILSLEVYK